MSRSILQTHTVMIEWQDTPGGESSIAQPCRECRNQNTQKSPMSNPNLQPGYPPVVGLTGGIASGKTTVSDWMYEEGAYVIDADSVGHFVIAPGGQGFDDVVAEFGQEIVGEDGEIDREKLGQIVFSDSARLQALNAIAHPRMAEMMQREIVRVRARPDAHQPPLIVLDAAILLEAGWDALCDEVWVVEAEPEIALARLMERNGLSEAQARARLAAQLTNEQRAARANEIIKNNQGRDALIFQVETLWDRITNW